MGGNVSPICRVHSSYRDHPALPSDVLNRFFALGGGGDGVKVTIHLSLVPRLLKVWSFTSSPPKTFPRCGVLIKHRNKSASHFIFFINSTVLCKISALMYLLCQKKKTEQHFENPGVPAQNHHFTPLV